MSDPDKKIAKQKLPVEIERDDGTLLMGFVFISPQGRLSDLINDSRTFLPFESSSGKFSLLSKSSLLSVAPLNQEREIYEGNDPFQVLGLSEEISLAELKRTYFKLCIDHHPDKVKGLGLPDEFVELANIRMARINEAFQRAFKLKAFAETEQMRVKTENVEGVTSS